MIFKRWIGVVLLSLCNMLQAQEPHQINDMETDIFVSLNLNVEYRLADNALFTDAQKRIGNSYTLLYDAYGASNSNLFTRSYFQLNNTNYGITGGFGFKMSYGNYLYVSIESLARKQYWFNYNKNGSVGSDISWTNPLFVVHYIKKWNWTKHWGMSVSAGVGIGLDTKSNNSTIFESNLLSSQRNPTYFYTDEGFKVSTGQNYRNSIYPVATPKIQLNYRLDKHFQLQAFCGAYFSLGNHDGIHVELRDLKNDELIQSVNYNFHSANTFFGLGLAYYWKRK